MSFPSAGLKQKITYWTPGAPDGFGGTAWGTPVTVNGRWEQRAETFRDERGDEQVSRSIVWLTEDVSIGDFLFLGASTASDPTLLGAHEVRQFVSTPDLRNVQQERRAYL